MARSPTVAGEDSALWMRFLTTTGEGEENRDMLSEYFFSHAMASPEAMARFLDVFKRFLQKRGNAGPKRAAAARYLEVLSPICERIGLFEEKNVIDSLCFRTIEPQASERVETMLRLYKRKSNATIARVIAVLSDMLKKEGFDFEIKGRYKSVYSIHRKLKRKSRNDLLSLQDIFAFRIILGDARSDDCVEVVNLLHDRFYPVAGSFKDYITIPKINGYQSIHTILNHVLPDLDLPIEVQIRTRAMHEIAEKGFASHWLYSRNKRSKLLTEKERKLIDHMSSLSKMIHADRSVYCFTPNGDLQKLPAGATAADFAGQIHSELGRKAAAAVVNGKRHALHVRLRNGDSIRILKQNDKNHSPASV